MPQQNQTLLNLLQKSNLNEKEAKVYLALLELGEATASEISKNCGLKRTLIYAILENLTEKGYVSSLPGRKIFSYQAIDPGAISAQIQLSAKHFSEMLPIFKSLADQKSGKPKISYLETKEAILKVYDEINSQKEAFFIASLIEIEKHFPGSIAYWKKSYQKKFNKLESKTLIPDNPQEIALAKEFIKITDKVSIKTLPGMKECSMDISFWKNKLAITTYDDKIHMVIIESPSITGFITPIFNILWQSGKQIKF